MNNGILRHISKRRFLSHFVRDWLQSYQRCTYEKEMFFAKNQYRLYHKTQKFDADFKSVEKKENLLHTVIKKGRNSNFTSLFCGKLFSHD
jgi:hypothetical protein